MPVRRVRVVLALALALALGACAGTDQARPRSPTPTTPAVPFDVAWQARLGKGSTLVADFDGDGADDTMSMYNAGLWINIQDWFVDLALATGETQTLGMSTFGTGISFGDPLRLIQVADLPGQVAKGAWANVGYSAITSQIALLVVHEGRLQGATIDGRPGMFGRSFSVGGIVGKATGTIECLDGASTVKVHWTGQDAHGHVEGTTTFHLDGTTFSEVERESSGYDVRTGTVTGARTPDCPAA